MVSVAAGEPVAVGRKGHRYGARGGWGEGSLAVAAGRQLARGGTGDGGADSCERFAAGVGDGDGHGLGVLTQDGGGKVRLVVERVSVGAARPVPVRAAVWVPRLSTMVKAPDAGPEAVGTNSTTTEHAAPARRTVPQELGPRTKGAEVATEVMETEAGVVFWTLMDWEVVVPTCCEPKAMLAGVRTIPPPATAGPVRGIRSWPPVILAAIAS